jgi:general stress protein 26
MDSINREQPEHQFDHLAGHDAIERIREMVEDVDICFFVTRGGIGPSAGIRPMSARKVGPDGRIWFLSASDSHKNSELEHDPAVTLHFQGSSRAEFLTLEGEAEITRDKDRIRDLWTPILKTWFTEGEDDPRITAIGVSPHSGYYWDTKHGRAVAGVKMVIGALTGRTFDDSIEGRLRV